MAEASREEAPVGKLFRNIDYFTRQLNFSITKDNSSHYVSPLALHAFFTLLSEMAQGHSRQELERIVFSQGAVHGDHYRVFLLETLDTNATFELKLHKKLYIPTRYELELRILIFKDAFKVEVEHIDFINNIDAAQTINTWFDDASNHHIQDMVTASDFDAETRLVLLNASYFRGSFLHPFMMGATYRGEYMLYNGERVDCEFMCMEGLLLYAKNKELMSELLQLKFTNQDFSMLLIVPELGRTLEQTERNLRNVSFRELIETVTTRHVAVKLPKFKIEYRIDLTEVLKEFGLRNCYGPFASFEGIHMEHLPRDCVRLSKVIQKCSIGINEFGGDTADVGGYDPTLENPPPSPPPTGMLSPVDLTVNRPFLFVVLFQDEGYHCPLTFGKVYEPGV